MPRLSHSPCGLGALAVSLAFFCVLIVSPVLAQLETLPLEGTWGLSFAAGPAVGNALPPLAFSDTIVLPATTETAGKGPLSEERRLNMLTAVRRIEGPVWYQRDFELPATWSDMSDVRLFIERSKCSHVWLDETYIGESRLFSAPQRFSLGKLAPGKHRLTVCVDNSLRPIPGWGENHAITEHTQGNWNGLLGRIELQGTGPLRLADLQIDARADERRLDIQARVAPSQEPFSQRSTLLVSASTLRGIKVAEREFPLNASIASVSLPLDKPALWDEFEPNLYRVKVALMLDGKPSDKRFLKVGFRDFTADRGQFRINGRTLFLRGKHDGCVFPLTGHPPMDAEGWRNYFAILAQYGINHVRFHSWTPPEAAFDVADELGFYLQPELPFWGTYNEAARDAILPEADAILAAYGSHPSFVMFSLGNENRGSRAIMAEIVQHLRKTAPRRLYAQGSNNFHWAPQIAKEDDYWTSGRLPTSDKARLANVRGSFSTNDRDDGHIQVGPPSTQVDYSDAIAGVPMPVIGHEIGQYTVMPDYRELPRYTGVFRPYNLEAFREKALSAGLLERADLFFRASGKLAALNYREEVESALRTSRFGGFQLLDLQDYPGQGTALIGLLNAFLESKGAITPEEWRRFCAPLVLLGRFERYVWTEGETLQVRVQLAHYGKSDLARDTLDWSLRDTQDRVLASGSSATAALQRGGLREVATLALALPRTQEALQARLVLCLRKAGVANEYPLWLYPSRQDESPRIPESVTLVRTFDEEARKALEQGKAVVLMPDAEHPLARQVGGGFATDFWCWPMFKNTPGTMGLLCAPQHPALKLFPTEFHSNYQWFAIAMASQPLVLDDLPKELVPFVEPIDNLERMHRLGLLFESKVGPGRLLVCAADLPALAKHDRPSRQLLKSLLSYAASPAFAPKVALSPEALIPVLRARLKHGALTCSSSAPNRGPARAADNNDENSWEAASNAPGEWWQEDFAEPARYSEIELVLGKAGPGYSCLVESSPDGKEWQTLAQLESAGTERLLRAACAAAGVKHCRVRFVKVPPEGKAALAEVRFLQ